MSSLSAQTRRRAPSRETIGRVIGGWPIWLNRAGLGRLAVRRDAAIRPVGRRTGRVRRVAVLVLREVPATGEVLVAGGTRDACRYRDVCARPAAEVQTALFGWPWPGSDEDVGSLASSLGGVSRARAPRSGARDARSR